jgi:trigger factor
MNIVKENIDDLNALIKVKVEKADYEESVEKTLKDYRKKANIKGFRPGNVPIGLIRKMYGTAVKVEEINRSISEGIQKFLADEKIDILGDPLPREDEGKHMNFETDEEFELDFEIGISPEFELKLSKKNKITGYKIIIDEKMKSDYIDNIARRYGNFMPAEAVEEKDMLKGDIIQLNNDGTVNTDGFSANNSTLSINMIKDEAIKASFIGHKIKDVIDFDIKKAFPNDYEIAGLLQKKKDEIEGVEGNFRFIVNEITRFTPAELNQELYDMVYGTDVIKSKEEFEEKIKEEIASNLKRETDYKLLIDLKEYVTSKTEMTFPEDFLKKWLMKVNEDLTREQLDEDFDSFIQDLKWQLIRNKVATENNMTVTEEELQNEAEAITRYQFQQYGYYYATDEQISGFAKQTLSNQEEAKRIAAKILDNKVLLHMKDVVKVDEKEISSEEFNKLFE